MRALSLFGLLLLLLVTVGPGSQAIADDKQALNEADAKELVAKAASVSIRYLNTLVSLGSKVTRDDLVAKGTDVPLTLAAVFLGGRELDERDFKLTGRVTPKDFMEAVYPHEVRLGMRIAKHPYASILHKEYVQDITVKVNGRTATGDVRFRAPGVYEGTVRFTAFRDATGWRVLELAFPHSKVRTLLQNGRWRLQMPDGAIGANQLVQQRLLPQVGTVGKRPEGRTSVVITVTRDGWIRVPGEREPLSINALQRWLQIKTRNPRLREPDGSSRIDAVLDIDETTPWLITQWLMMVCAHPSVKIHKIWLGARARDGKRGAIATVLPKDRSLPIRPAPIADFVKVKLKVLKYERFQKPSDMRALYAQLRKMLSVAGNPQTAVCDIVAPPMKDASGGAVPHGYVVQMVDVCLAAGARHIFFEGAPMPMHGELQNSAEELQRRIAKLKQRPGVPRVRLGNSRAFVPADGAELPAVPARGLIAGRHGVAPAAALAMIEEVLEEEIEEVEEEVEEKPVEDPVIEDEELKDEPFTGPPSGGSIGLGGSAGGAFRGRGGRNKLRVEDDWAKLLRSQDQAVERALRWLAAHQSPNGGWSATDFRQWCDGKPSTDVTKQPDGLGKHLYDPGVTGLALQAFLGAGYTNRGKHPFAKVVSRGLRFLKNIQDPEGCFGPRSSQQYVYNHAMAAAAMVEAYGMTGSPIFKGSAQRALDFVAHTRNPYFAWRYGVKPGDNDTSVTGWMAVPLHAARLINQDAIKRGKPAPLTIDEQAFEGIKAWLDKVTDPGTGRVGYIQRGGSPARPRELVDRFPGESSESMTAVGVLLRIMGGEDPRTSKRVKKGLALIAKKPPVWNLTNGRIDMVYWHWGMQAMFQAGGEHYRGWLRAAKGAIVDTQRLDTTACSYQGSWDPVGPWGLDGGRVYSTALMALTLQVRYRYVRVFGTK